MGKNSFWILFFFSIPGSAPTFRGSFLSKLTMSSLGPIPSKNCYNFSVCLSISLFLVSKNHGRRPRFFEAKNTQKLRRVRKLLAKNKPKKQKKRQKRLFFFVFLLITFLFFNRFQLSLLQKVASVHSHRPCEDRLETPKGLGVIRKNKMKKQ